MGTARRAAREPTGREGNTLPKIAQLSGKGTMQPPSSTPDTLIQAALQYAHYGWRVFPCRPRSKVPLVKWKAGATTDRHIICAWWLRWPDANVAIATGVESGLAVIDIDSFEAFKAFSMAFPDALNTCVVQTGRASGGLHLYYRLTKPKRSIRGQGIELKADGAYVLAPPSIHDKTGQPYRVLRYVNLYQ
jgi:hypothetical protein